MKHVPTLAVPNPAIGLTLSLFSVPLISVPRWVSLNASPPPASHSDSVDISMIKPWPLYVLQSAGLLLLLLLLLPKGHMLGQSFAPGSPREQVTGRTGLGYRGE
jgi:hypothetical protein